MNHIIKFPSDFVWGASLSAHQTEGGNINDWSEWELANADRLGNQAEAKNANKIPNWEQIKHAAGDPSNYISGAAANFYIHYHQDIVLASELKLNALRFSVEWSRVEPNPGQFSHEALEYYKDIVRSLKEKNILPVVTLQHRTLPLWISKEGGWGNPATVKHFVNFVKKIVLELKNDVTVWMPINEPIMSIAGGYLGGVYPPGKRSWIRAFKAYKNMVSANNQAYKLIHRLIPSASVGMAHAAVYADPYQDRWINRVVIKVLDYLANFKILKESLYDFIGVQYYTRGVIDIRFGKYFLPRLDEIIMPGVHTDMGWEIYPIGLYNFLLKLKRFGKPIYITENGIADAKDSLREKFITDHLVMARRAMDAGVNLKGYFYWALLDNMEWDKGFWPRFGLIEVDYKNYARTIRNSALSYKNIIENNGFEITLNKNEK